LFRSPAIEELRLFPFSHPVYKRTGEYLATSPVQETVIMDLVLGGGYTNGLSAPRSERILKILLNIIPDLRKGFVLDAWTEHAKAIYEEYGEECPPALSRVGEKAGDANDLESKETEARDEVGERRIFYLSPRFTK
jgi:hypothetical protein